MLARGTSACPSTHRLSGMTATVIVKHPLLTTPRFIFKGLVSARNFSVIPRMGSFGADSTPENDHGLPADDVAAVCACLRPTETHCSGFIKDTRP